MEHRAVFGLEAFQLVGLHAEDLHHPRAHQRLLQVGGQLGQARLSLARVPAHLFGGTQHRPHAQGEEDEGDQRQQPVLVEGHHHQRQQGESVANKVGEAIHQAALHQVHVREHARHQHRGGVTVHIGLGQLQHLAGQVGPQVGGDPLAHRFREVATQKLGHGPQADHPHDHQGRQVEAAAVVGRQDVVEQGADHQRHQAR